MARMVQVRNNAATVRTSCNCLTKEYLADGTVLFKDLCTKEMALAPANNTQAAR